MAKQKLSDAEGKAILKKWPNRTKLWPPPQGQGYWLKCQPKAGFATGPKLTSPGASLFSTQPDGLWVHFSGLTSCDVVAIEVCGSTQNLNDKRSRYFPASHSVVLICKRAWFLEEIRVQRGAKKERWRAATTISEVPDSDVSIPIRHLRVLYALPNKLYHDWCPHHVPTGYELFCPHSSLDSYSAPKMQSFLRTMSLASRFYSTPK